MAEPAPPALSQRRYVEVTPIEVVPRVPATIETGGVIRRGIDRASGGAWEAFDHRREGRGLRRYPSCAESEPHPAPSGVPTGSGADAGPRREADGSTSCPL